MQPVNPNPEQCVQQFANFGVGICRCLIEVCPNNPEMITCLEQLKKVLEILPQVAKYVPYNNPGIIHLSTTAGAFCLMIVWIKECTDAIRICPKEEESLLRCVTAASAKVQEAANLLVAVQEYLKKETSKPDFRINEGIVTHVVFELGKVSGCLLNAEQRLAASKAHIERMVKDVRWHKQVGVACGSVMLCIGSAATAFFAPFAPAAAAGVGFGVAGVSNAVMILSVRNGFNELNRVERNLQTEICNLKADLNEQNLNNTTTTELFGKLLKIAENDFAKVGLRVV